MAWKRSSVLEPVISFYSVITSAIPDFIIGIILLVIFAFGLNWFPFTGAYDPDVVPGFNFDFIVNVFYHAALPILTFVITHIGYWALMMKGSAVSVLGEDYITAAKARGVAESRIMNQYVRKKCDPPVDYLVCGGVWRDTGRSGADRNDLSVSGNRLFFLGEATKKKRLHRNAGYFAVLKCRYGSCQSDSRFGLFQTGS